MRHLILILALILCSACNRTLPPEAKCGFLMTKEGRRVSWDKKVPVMLAVNAFIVGDNAVTIIKESAQAWNTAAGRELIRIVNDTSSVEVKEMNGVSTIYWLTDWSTDPTENALTTTFRYGAQILEADVRINARDHMYYVGNDSVFAGTDLKSVMIHEMGHVLGLAHSDEADSVMNPYLNPGMMKRSLGQSDINNLNCEY